MSKHNGGIATYSEWLFFGTGGKRGFTRLFSWGVIYFDIPVGFILSFVIESGTVEISQVFLIPLAGILVGFVVTTLGNVFGIVQTSELQHMATKQPGGIYDFVYSYLMAVMALFLSLLIVVLSQTGLPGYLANLLPEQVISSLKALYYIVIIYSLRFSWRTVCSGAYFIVAHHLINRAKSESENSG